MIKCNNCGEYVSHVKYCDKCDLEICENCNCLCNIEAKIYDTNYSYGLNSRVEIPLVYFITDGFDINSIICNLSCVWFEIEDPEFIEEIKIDFNKYPDQYEEKDWEWIIKNYTKFPKIKKGV